MFTFLLVIQILVSIAIISLVMLQQGKGADMGAGFGSGASGTVFGARGSGSFFTKATGILAAVFFVNCLLIASPLIRKSSHAGESLADRLEQQTIQQAADEQEQPASGQQPDGESVVVEMAEPATAGKDLPDVPDVQPAEPKPDMPDTQPAEPKPDDLPD
jgi:preprotein translocase subunit SecG